MTGRTVTHVFVISPGRSGTAFSAELFGASCSINDNSATIVQHEPIPVCAGTPMRLFNMGQVHAMQSLCNAKFKDISNVNGTSAVQVETNAQFIKAFGWTLLSSLSESQLSSIGVLHLSRDAELVAASFVANSEAPLFTAFGDVWNISPASTASLVHYNTNCLTAPIDAIRWQIAEIEARAAEMKQRFPQLVWHSATLNQFSTRDGAIAALAAFGLHPIDDSKLDAVLARTSVNSGAERAHAAPGVNDAAAISASEPRVWPHQLMADNVALVAKLCDQILSEGGAADRIRSQRRPLVGIGSSCMVGAKAELNRSLLNVSLTFAELQFQLICALCHRVDPSDVMFSFVRRVGNVWQLCDRINGAAPLRAPLSPLVSVAARKFVLVLVGAAGRLALHVLNAMICSHRSWLPANSELHLRLVTRKASVLRAQGVAADLIDGATQCVVHAETFSDDCLSDAFALGSDLTLLLASAPREPFDERQDLAARNAPLYERLADALVPTIGPIVVVANPVMSLASLLCQRQPSLAPRVSALMHTDVCRANAFVASQLDVAPRDVAGIVAVGNHSQNAHIDTSIAFVRTPDGSSCMLDDCLTRHTLNELLPAFVHSRGGTIIQLTGHTALFSVAQSVVDHVSHLLSDPADDGVLVSMGVFIDTADWRAKSRVFPAAACLPRCTMSADDVWPFARNYRGVFGMPVRRGGVVDWMAWVAATRSARARASIEASLSELEVTLTVARSLAQSPLLKAEMSRARAFLFEPNNNVLVLAGAGLSADVIPDLMAFDSQFAAIVARGQSSIFHVSNHAHFRREPLSAWGFFGRRAVLYGRAGVSPATRELSRFLLERSSSSWFVETTNLDCQFDRVGVTQVFERHGTLFDVQCSSNECAAPVERRPVEWFEALRVDSESFLIATENVPHCNLCGSVLRIATALAVDATPFRKSLQRDQRLQRDRFMEQALRSKSLMVILEVGAGVQMPKLRARASAIKSARRGLGLRTVHIRINKLHYAHERAHSDDLSIPLAAEEAFSHILHDQQ